MKLHPTAIIHPGAELADEVTIGPYSIVEEHVRIGAGTELAAHVHLMGWTTLGEGNRIHTGTVIGDLPQDHAFEPCESYVELGDRNVLREHVTIHRGTKPGSATRLGNGNVLMAGAHVGHNCHYHDEVVLVMGAMVSGYVEVFDRAFISGGCMIHQYVRIGRLAMVAAGSRIGKDLPPFTLGKGESRVYTLNTVGLRRAGFDAASRQLIKAAYRTVWEADRYEEGLEALANRAEHPLEKEIVEFLRTAGKRGVCRPHASQELAD